jgi:hypothetical protein
MVQSRASSLKPLHFPEFTGKGVKPLVKKPRKTLANASQDRAALLGWTPFPPAMIADAIP